MGRSQSLLRPSNNTKVVHDLMREISTEASSLPAAPLRALIPSLAHAERELAAELQIMAFKGTYSAQMLRRALVQIRGAMNAVELIRPEMRQALAHAGRSAGTMATRHLQKELTVFSGIFNKTLTPVPIVPAANMAQRSLLDRFARSANTYTEQVRGDIRHQITVGMLRGESFGEMTARLMGQRTVASVAKIEALGAAAQARAASAAIFRGARAKAERVVRTEVLNAYNTYSVDLIREVAKEDDRILKRWDAMFDGRLCGDCRSMHGIAIPVAEKFPFPSGESAPPLHPHCRCTTVIWRSDWGDHEGQSARKGMIKLQGWPET